MMQALQAVAFAAFPELSQTEAFSGADAATRGQAERACFERGQIVFSKLQRKLFRFGNNPPDKDWRHGFG